jgi:hypothetical protein
MVICCKIVKKTSDFSPEVHKKIGESTLKESVRTNGPMSEPMGGKASVPISVETYESAAKTIELIAEHHKHGIAVAVQKSLSTMGVDAGTELLDKLGSAVDRDGEPHPETIGEALTKCYIEQFDGVLTAAKESATYLREKGSEQKEGNERKG